MFEDRKPAAETANSTPWSAAAWRRFGPAADVSVFAD
jgi:hypothetical protein